MEEGTIVKWHSKEGDKLEVGAVLLEVATDKATVEYNVLDEGFLRKILVPEGTVAKVNQAVAICTASMDESIEGYAVDGAEKPKEQQPTEASEKKEEPAKEGAPKEGAEKAPAQAVGFKEPAFVPEPPLESYQFPISFESTDYIPASPLAKKLAKEKGLDLSTVKGTGANDRVMSKDLDLSQPDLLIAFGRREAPTEKPGSYEEIPLSPMRKAIGKRLQESKTFIPHFYIHQDVDVTSLFSLREELKNYGLKVTFNDFVLRAVALALKEHPNINTGYNSVNQTLIQFKTIDVAVAVTVEGGLITPIIRHADYKNLGQLSAEMKQLAKKAKEGKLDPTEYKGGSFTISNLGMFGVSDFVAVINPPQSSILAISGIDDKPVVVKGQVQIRKIMRITLSSDHRVVDGAEAAAFIKAVQKLLENPSVLIVS